VHKSVALSHLVQACQESANPLQHLQIVQFGVATATARADAEQKPCVAMECVSLVPSGRHHGHFRFDQRQCELVLFFHLGHCPSRWSIELGHNGVTGVQMDQIDPVFE